MKDSQDKLDEILTEFGEWAFIEGVSSSDGVLSNDWDDKDRRNVELSKAKSAIREHFLKEALEMLDGMPKLILKGKIEDDMGLFGDYVEVAELRNKFNDKYKED